MLSLHDVWTFVANGSGAKGRFDWLCVLLFVGSAAVVLSERSQYAFYRGDGFAIDQNIAAAGVAAELS